MKKVKENKAPYIGISITFIVSGILILPYLFWTGTYHLYTIGILAASLLPLIYKYLLNISRHTLIPILIIVASLFSVWLVIEALRCTLQEDFLPKTIPIIFIPYLLYIFGGAGTSVNEGVPTTLNVAFNIYGLTVFLFFAGLYLALKKRVNLLFLVFSIILLLATLGQRRWGYYFTIPVGLLSAYLIFEISKLFKKNLQASIISIILIFVVLTSIKGTIGVVRLENNISLDWYNSLVWMRNNTPDPFEDKDAYYKLSTGKAQYGVLSWWDYGHWITRIARRTPMTTPAFQIIGAAGWFLIEPPIEAEKYIRTYNIKYIIIDKDMVEGKFYALVQRYWPAATQDEIAERRLYSMVTKLWNEEVPGYKLIYQEGNVKIIERLASN